MWKIILFCTFLSVSQANIRNIYGDWTMVAFYPVASHQPTCIRFSFTKSPVSIKCSYADGRRAIPVQVSMTSEKGEILERYSMPMRVVETPEEVMPGLEMGCKCGNEEVNDHAVVRIINENYFIMFHYITKESSRTETEPNAAYVFAKNVEPQRKLAKFTSNVDDLKGRKGAMMCYTENFNGFGDENEI
ncbi:uncharacterized protein LOC126910731 [Spodoptera frugiperda]|uniref:Uncharacterized protein LOC126910731 n=1 Tax=Spodoptera frugiperda TaxID=7108 RepID=A0A9R0EU55_SPOFR|nr:uncharacterized protein LOC126910731 [Spodoptera frugiperda]